jgi:hypothetical protein
MCLPALGFVAVKASNMFDVHMTGSIKHYLEHHAHDHQNHKMHRKVALTSIVNHEFISQQF